MTFAYRNGTEMANRLAASVSDPEYIRRCVLSNFDWAPSVATIQEMQAKHARQAARIERMNERDASAPVPPAASRDSSIVDGSNALLRKLWSEHPRIVAQLRRKQGLGA